METAEEYLRRVHDEIRDRYSGDCLRRAREIADRLRAAGQSPQLLRYHRESTVGGERFIEPLTPLMYLGRAGPTWTTHYVCSADSLIYDPILGTAVAIEDYSFMMFGKVIEPEYVSPT